MGGSQRLAVLLCGGILFVGLLTAGAAALDSQTPTASAPSNNTTETATQSTCSVTQSTSCSVPADSSRAPTATRADRASESAIHLVFFYSPSCSHCQEVEDHLAEIQEQSNISLHIHEKRALVHQELMQEFANEYDIPQDEQGAVPATYFADGDYAVGADRSINLINQKIEQYNESGIGPPDLIQGTSADTLRSPPGQLSFLLLGLTEVVTPVALAMIIIGFGLLIGIAKSDDEFLTGERGFVLAVGLGSTLVGGLLAAGVVSDSITALKHWFPVMLGLSGLIGGFIVLLKGRPQELRSSSIGEFADDLQDRFVLSLTILGGSMIGAGIAMTSDSYRLASASLVDHSLFKIGSSLLLYNGMQLLVVGAVGLSIWKVIAVLPDPFATESGYGKRVSAVILIVFGVGLVVSGLV